MPRACEVSYELKRNPKDVKVGLVFAVQQHTRDGLLYTTIQALSDPHTRKDQATF